MSINSDIPFLECSKISMSENSRSFMWILPMFNNTRLGHCRLLHRCYLDVLGPSFPTHSRILFSSEYFHYKIFTSRGPLPGRGPAVEKHWHRETVTPFLWPCKWWDKCILEQWLIKINPGGGEIFRTCPDRPWGPPSLLYNGYRVYPGGKAAGAWCRPHYLLLVLRFRKSSAIPLLTL
jgi:hypothetical protein